MSFDVFESCHWRTILIYLTFTKVLLDQLNQYIIHFYILFILNMFYSYELFVRKGPLAKIWIAGTAHQKLNKLHILEAAISKMCGAVADPPVKLALPTQSILLKGIVRIEYRKAEYLLSSAIEMRSKLYHFKSTPNVDLPRMKSTSRFDHITLPVNDVQFDIEGFENNFQDIFKFIDLEEQVEVDLSFQVGKYKKTELKFQANAEDITIEEEKVKKEIIDTTRDDPLVIPEANAVHEDPLDFSIECHSNVVGRDSISNREYEDYHTNVVAENVRGSPYKKRRIVKDSTTQLTNRLISRHFHDTEDICIQRPLKARDLFSKSFLSERFYFPSMDFQCLELRNVFRDICVKLESISSNEPVAELSEESEDFLDNTLGISDAELESEEVKGFIISESSDITDVEVPRQTKANSLSDDEFSRKESSLYDSFMEFGKKLDLKSKRRQERGTGYAFFEESKESVLPYDTEGMDLPELDITGPTDYSFDIQESMEKEPQGTQITAIFKKILEDNFNLNTSKPVILDEALDREVKKHAQPNETVNSITVSVYDAAISLQQILILKTHDVIDVRQDIPYGDIYITKGPKWLTF